MNSATLRATRSRTLISLATLALLAHAAGAQPLQISEPPELAGANVGSVAVDNGNSVRGSIASSWGVDAANWNGDISDTFSVTVPSGVRVNGLQVRVSGYINNIAIARVTLRRPGLAPISLDPTGNGTFTFPGISVLTQGTYTFTIDGVPLDDSAGNVAFTYEIRLPGEFNNDACAQPLNASLGNTNFDNRFATNDGPFHSSCVFRNNGMLERDVWFRFVPAVTALITASTCGSNFDAKLAIYSGTNCNILNQTVIACDDDSCGPAGSAARASVVVNAGQAILIRVGGYLGATGTGTLNISQNTAVACCNTRTGQCTIIDHSVCASLGLAFTFGGTCSPATCRACPADFNGASGVSVQDIFDFLAAWFGGCP